MTSTATPASTQRRSRRAREVLGHRASLVGSRRANSGRCTRSIRCGSHGSSEMAGGIATRTCSTSAAAAASSSEAMARDGARVTGIDLSTKALGVARLHGLESGIAVDLPARRRRSARARVARTLRASSRAWRCSSTCPIPRRSSPRARRSRRPAERVVFATLNRNPKSYVYAILGAEYILRLLPRGTHDWSRFIRPAELARFARRAGLDLAGMTGMTYNPLTRVYRSSPTRRSTTSRPSASLPCAETAARPLPVSAVLFDLDGTLADSAGDLALALNRIRESRGLQPVPAADLRPYASSGARGLLHRGMDVTPDHPEYAALRESFLANYEACLARDHDAVRGRARHCSTPSRRAACAGASSPTSTSASRCPSSRRSGSRNAPASSWPATRRRTPSRIPRRCCTPRKRSRVAPSACVYVGDDLRDVEAGSAAGMATIVAGYGYMGVGGDPKRWPATGWIDRPLDLLAWLPAQRVKRRREVDRAGRRAVALARRALREPSRPTGRVRRGTRGGRRHDRSSPRCCSRSRRCMLSLAGTWDPRSSCVTRSTRSSRAPRPRRSSTAGSRSTSTSRPFASLHNWRASTDATPCVVVELPGEWGSARMRAFCGNRFALQRKLRRALSCTSSRRALPFTWTRDERGIRRSRRSECRAAQWRGSARTRQTRSCIGSGRPGTRSTGCASRWTGRSTRRSRDGRRRRRHDRRWSTIPADPATLLPAQLVRQRQAVVAVVDDRARRAAPSASRCGSPACWLLPGGAGASTSYGRVALVVVPLAALPWWSDYMPRAIRFFHADIGMVSRGHHGYDGSARPVRGHRARRRDASRRRAAGVESRRRHLSRHVRQDRVREARASPAGSRRRARARSRPRSAIGCARWRMRKRAALFTRLRDDKMRDLTRGGHRRSCRRRAKR